MPFSQGGDGGEVDVQPVAGDDLTDRGLVPRGCGQQWRQLTEVVLEPGRRDQLQQPCRLLAGVSERMGDTTRLDDEVSGSRLEGVVAELDAESSLDHEGVLVLVVVGMERGAQRPWREWVLDQAERTTGPFAVDQEADSQGEQVHDLALVRAEQAGDRCGHRGTPFD